MNIIMFIFLGTLGWGASLYLIKILLVILTPAEIVLYRMCIGGVTLLLLTVIMRCEFNNFKALVKNGAIVGICNIALPFYLTTWAQKNVSGSLTSVINGITPLLTLLISITLFSNKESISPAIMASILIGIMGMAFVNIDMGASHQSLINIMALILSSFSYGIAANYIKYSASANNPFELSTIAAFVSVIFMIIFKLSFETPLQWHYPVTFIQYVSLFWLGAISSGLCLYLYFILIRNVGAITSSMITYLMTITGVIMGVMVLNESLAGLTLIGCGCLVLSLLIVNHASLLQKWLEWLINTISKRSKKEF